MGISVFPTPSATQLYSRVAYVTSTGTWSHPDGYASPRPVKVLAYNGGFGGFGGVATIDATFGYITNVGGGGPSGYVTSSEGFISSDLTITVGAGGSGQPGATGTSTSYLQTTPNGIAGIPGTTIVTGTGMNISVSTTSYHKLFYTLTMISSNQSRGVSGGGQSGAPATTGVAVGGTRANRGVNHSAEEKDVERGGSAILGTMGTIATTATGVPNLDDQVRYSNGGGGAGGWVSQTGVAGIGSPGGAHALGVSAGGAGGAAAAASGANATATAGATGGAFGGGGGGGGNAWVVTTNISRTVTSGAGGAGGNGGVIIYY